MRTTTEQGSLAGDYAAFIGRLSRSAAGGDRAPATIEGWERRLRAVREGLLRSFGRAPDRPAPLEPEILGTLQRDGYAIERLTFQSRPGVRVTANLYRPEPARGRAPAVLSVHGHWPWARVDPHVQPRCIGLAKLGYVVLCVDAFGAGERAVEPGPGTYHGALLGASLWPVGTPLIGLQIYDNRRAVDYLISRPEVDPSRLAITGASGGGNQTFYAGATDERFAAVIPVCGIGTYDAYLKSACCVCEVNVAGAAYATAGDILGLVAPRALLVISATRDAFQFSVGEAAKSIAYARERYRILGHPDKIRHVAIESGHDYNRPMREAMYGWVEKWLRGRGDGSPIAEPPITVEDVEALRCYPKGTTRPKAIITIAEFAQRAGQERLAALPKPPDHRQRWEADAERMRTQLRDGILGGFPQKTPLEPRLRVGTDGVDVTITTERGIRALGRALCGSGSRPGTAIVLSAESAAPAKPGAAVASASPLDKLRSQGRDAGVSILELTHPRGTGPWLDGVGPVAGVPDHDPAEWGLWVNRPLLGQWVWDLVRWLDFLDEARLNPLKARSQPARPTRPFVLIGLGAMSLPALLTAALDPRVAAVGCSDCLVSFVGRQGKPWSRLPMGLIVPNILDVGDLGHLAALVAPRRLVITGGVEPEGHAATADRLADAFAFTRSIYRLLGSAASLEIGGAADIGSLLSGA
jgi:dienelactone hydrolase